MGTFQWQVFSPVLISRAWAPEGSLLTFDPGVDRSPQQLGVVPHQQTELYPSPRIPLPPFSTPVFLAPIPTMRGHLPLPSHPPVAAPHRTVGTRNVTKDMPAVHHPQLADPPGDVREHRRQSRVDPLSRQTSTLKPANHYSTASSASRSAALQRLPLHPHRLGP